jgi:hypothetical protein
VVALVVGLTGLGALARGAIRARGSLGWTVGQVSERRRRRVGGPKRLIEPEEGEGDWMAEDDDEDDDLPPRPHLAPVEDEDEDAD